MFVIYAIHSNKGIHHVHLYVQAGFVIPGRGNKNTVQLEH